MSSDTATPEVLWAQRSSKTDATKNFVYLTISVPDVPKSALKLDLKPSGLSFTGKSDTLKKTYKVDLDFFAEIDTAESKINHTARDIEMKLIKKDLNEEYWPRLLKESKKLHFLKTDFDKWVDEDEQNEAAEDDFSNFGGMGSDFGGIDFSKLGGGAGAGAGEEEEEDEEEDEDMPALEGEEDDDDDDDDEEEDAAAGKKKAAA